MQAKYIPVIKWIFDVSGGCKLGLAASVTVPGQKLAPHTPPPKPSFSKDVATVSDNNDVRFETVVLVKDVVGSGIPPEERTETKERRA